MPRLPAEDRDTLRIVFRGEIWYWRGPAPFLFVTVPDDGSAAIHAIAPVVTYGWGVIPVTVRLGGTVWPTSLFRRTAGTSCRSWSLSSAPNTSPSATRSTSRS